MRQTTTNGSKYYEFKKTERRKQAAKITVKLTK